MYWNYHNQVIQSDLFIPYLEVTNSPWKGHLTIPKGSPSELPGIRHITRILYMTSKSEIASPLLPSNFPNFISILRGCKCVWKWHVLHASNHWGIDFGALKPGFSSDLLIDSPNRRSLKMSSKKGHFVLNLVGGFNMFLNFYQWSQQKWSNLTSASFLKNGLVENPPSC